MESGIHVGNMKERDEGKGNGKGSQPLPNNYSVSPVNINTWSGISYNVLARAAKERIEEFSSELNG
uniref:Uncharacterized protein n=1 Tax=Rhizophagus irregularis (strain DAOM 181602 / DAOM 197198 / MUCL 43194) TaxID=747089 RepID=U9TB63_RHIID